MQVYWTDGAKSKFTSQFIYGLSGSGKTPLAGTLPLNETMIVCSEPGLKSLQTLKLPYILGRTHKEAMDAITWLKGKECASIRYVFFDSSSALSEAICNDEMRKSKDPRSYSPATFRLTMEIINSLLEFPSLGKNVIVTSKAVAPQQSMPGNMIEPFAAVPKLGPSLPYHFDDVLFLQRQTDKTTGQPFSFLTCQANDFCVARNRTGMLEMWEPANLSQVIAKSNGVA